MLESEPVEIFVKLKYVGVGVQYARHEIIYTEAFTQNLQSLPRLLHSPMCSCQKLAVKI